MRLSDVKAAALSLTAEEQEILIQSLLAQRGDFSLSESQRLDLEQREREFDAGEAELLDGETAMDELFNQFAPNVQRKRHP